MRGLFIPASGNIIFNPKNAITAGTGEKKLYNVAI
ncbi:MAG: hypothetical protein H6Q93_939 [Nitrospirae bacterium]|nr:hypothetical protein [Nitrospirota bacterium]MBS1126950.1 hypothetical protein [Nitrospirota bacterium]